MREEEFWGWSVDDFKRELRQQLLAQKVVSTLDTGTHDRAESVLKQLNQGGDFAQLAAQNSDDTATAAGWCDYGIAITEINRDLPSVVVNELFKMQVNQTSGIINTGNTLEIVKLKEKTGDQVKAAHISFVFKDIDTYVKPLEKKEKTAKYIHP